MLYKSKLWMEDLNRAAEALPELFELAGKSVLVTGASGLVCSPVIDLFLCFNETHLEKIRILAAGRHSEAIQQRFGPYFEKDYFQFVPYDASKAESPFLPPCDYIIHGAGNAYPELIMKEPVETMLSNIWGLYGLLRHGRKNDLKRLLYVSSSEVYGKRERLQPYREDEYGYVDLLNPRNSYSMAKRAAETLCISYTEEYGIESIIVRLGHIYGPTASVKDNRVSSAWAHMAARGQNIVMKSDGAQVRSYCYCLDCASAMIKVLLKGEQAQAYNISNPASIISIREIAELFSEAGQVRFRMEYALQADRVGFNPMQNSSLDSTLLQKLGWKGLWDAREGVSRTIQILKEIM